MQERRILEALLGVYVAMVLVPAGALFVRWAVFGGVRIGVLAATGLVVTVVVALGARTVADLADSLATLPVATASVLPPLAYLPYKVLATPPGSANAPVCAVGLLAVLPGIAVPVGGAVVRSRRLRDAATELAVVTVSDDDAGDGRDWPVVVGATVVAVSFVGFGVVALATDDASIESIAPAFGGISTSLLLLADDGSTEVPVTDQGLLIDRSITRWDDLDGYRVSEGSIELVRSRWYLPTRGFDRDEIGDEDALVERLSEFLPRLDEHGRVKATARR